MQDLTNVYDVDAENGVVRYTIKAHGEYFTGMSKVNTEGGDVFDENTGKRIAKLRAILKMKNAALRNALDALEWIRGVAAMEEDAQDIVQALTQSTYNVHRKLNEVLGIDLPDEEVGA